METVKILLIILFAASVASAQDSVPQSDAQFQSTFEEGMAAGEAKHNCRHMGALLDQQRSDTGWARTTIPESWYIEQIKRLNACNTPSISTAPVPTAPSPVPTHGTR